MPTLWDHDHQDVYSKLEWVSHPSLKDAIISLVPPAERLLDLGAGTGVALEWLKGKVSERRAVEMDSGMASQISSDVEVQVGRLEDHEWDGWADCVLMRNVLHYTVEPEEALQHAARALQPGGRLILIEGVPPTSDVLDWYRKMFSLIDGRHVFSEADLLSLVRRAGLATRALVPVFLEGINLQKWIQDRVPEDAQDAVLSMHMDHQELLRTPYEWDGKTMTWRFAVIEAVRP